MRQHVCNFGTGNVKTHNCMDFTYKIAHTANLGTDNNATALATLYIIECVNSNLTNIVSYFFFESYGLQFNELCNLSSTKKIFKQIKSEFQGVARLLKIDTPIDYTQNNYNYKAAEGDESNEGNLGHEFV